MMMGMTLWFRFSRLMFDDMIALWFALDWHIVLLVLRLSSISAVVCR